MVLLENDGLNGSGPDKDSGVHFEYFKNRNLADLLTGLTCQQLDRVRLADIPLVLARYNRLMGRDPWSVYPQSMRNCFREKVMDFLSLKNNVTGTKTPQNLGRIQNVKC